MASLLADVNALCGILDEENAVLASNALTSHHDFASRKLRLLRTLLGHSKSTDHVGDARSALERLKQALAANERLLAIHLGATRNVASAIITSIRAEESDCTYERARARMPLPPC